MRLRHHAPRWPSLGIAFLALASIPALGDDWKPARGPLMTKWAADVRADKVLPEYPRPQLVRDRWLNLNGVWGLGFGKEGDAVPVGKALSDQILVPFPVESALSGVMKTADRLWYRRTFAVPEDWAGSRVILHFGAVDWEAQVYLNGKDLGTHRGGFDPFSVDLTDALRPGGDQELIVRVFDPTDAGPQPRGKQVSKPEGIYYTPTTGIWQTVWIEPVAASSIQGLKIVPNVDKNRVEVSAEIRGAADGLTLEVIMFRGVSVFGQGETVTANGGVVQVDYPAVAALWTPESPNLYSLKVRLKRGGTTVDAVSSYVGLRKVDIARDENGKNQIRLNGKPIFLVGPLDQGFWPDGLYTAPTDEALKFDIEITKRLGFNMARKHVKVEPARWYYWCDTLGLVVWQDMPSGDRSISPSDPDLTRSPESAATYDRELKAMIDALRNHPSIVLWVVFNEGWGQFDTARVASWTKRYDPTRLVDAASGWADRAGVGDVHDLHSYPNPAAPPAEPSRAGVLGEFGGLALGVNGHTWTDRTWGYQGTASQAELTRKYERLLRAAYELKERNGLAAAVYTQTTDVETEANGLLTYDRAVIKVDVNRVAAVNRGDYAMVPVTRVVVPDSRAEGLPWRYTTAPPAAGWAEPAFDDSSWSEGPGVLGTAGTPGANVRTTWNTPDVWARRSFVLPDVATDALYLSLLHDEDAEVYLNGVLAATARGYVGSYDEVEISREARATLKPGKNAIAVRCHQTRGGQSIDVGIVEVREPGR